MEENKMKFHSHQRPGFIFGAILMLIGGLFLAFNFGLLESGWKHVVFSWQMLLIVIGVVSMLHRHVFTGLTLVTIGGFFIMPRLATACPETFHWVQSDFVRTYWPILLILAGVLILFHVMYCPSRHTSHCYTNASSYKKQHSRKSYSCNSGFERNSVFGNVEEIILDPVFAGGEFNAVFGGITLDLRKTTIPEGETVMELNGVFGGITVYAPDYWHIQFHMDSAFGGFQDNRARSEEIDHSRKLIILGACVFGGVEIRS